MQFIDVAKRIGRVGFFPLLIIFAAAGAAFACPEHNGRAGYRTKTVVHRSASYSTPTTVITYRAPRSYQRCGNALIDTRGKRYVASRVRHHDDARYVASRNDRYYAPRYVAVRRAEPRERLVRASELDRVYDDDIRYVPVRRSAPAVRYVAIRDDIDDYDYAPRARYVYRDAPRARYVAVRSMNGGCVRVARRCGDDIDRVSTRRVITRDDYGYSAPRAKYVAVREDWDDDDDDDRVAVRSFVDHDVADDDYVSVSNEINHDAEMVYNDEPEYVAPQVRHVRSNSYIEYRDADYYGGGDTHLASNYIDHDRIQTRRISYIDDQAYLDEGDAIYIAAADVDDACLRPVSYYEPPARVSTRTISYAPPVYDDDVDDYAFHGGVSQTYVEAVEPAETVAYVPAEMASYDVSYVAADDMQMVSDVPVDYVDDADMHAVSYAPMQEVEYVDCQPVRCVSTNDIAYVPARRASYAKVKKYHSKKLSYVPRRTSVMVDDVAFSEDDCEHYMSVVEAEPTYVVEEPRYVVREAPRTVIVERRSAAVGNTLLERVASGKGYRDGYEEGKEDAREGNAFTPLESGDYWDADDGYEREYGDREAYKEVYRDAFEDGYRAGFNSEAVDF